MPTLTRVQLSMTILLHATASQEVLWHGPAGCGKSYLAECVYRTVKDKLIHPRWGIPRAVRVYMNELIRDILAYGGDSSAMARFRNDVKRASIVVLDELGREKDPDGNALQWVLDTIEREAPYALTLLTSNFAPDELATHYGEAIESRLAKFHPMGWTGCPDLRVEQPQVREIPDFENALLEILQKRDPAYGRVV